MQTDKYSEARNKLYKEQIDQLRKEIDHGFLGELVPYTQAVVEDVKARGRKRYKNATPLPRRA